MKRPAAAICLGFGLSGLGLGLIEAGRWLHALSVQVNGLSNIFSLIRYGIVLPVAMMVIGPILSLRQIASLLHPENSAAWLRKTIFSISAACLLCWVTFRISNVFCFAPFYCVPILTLTLIVVGSLISYVFSPVAYRSVSSSLVKGIIAGSIVAAFILLIRLASSDQISFGGFGTFTSLFDPPQIRNYPSLVQDLATGALLGLTTGMVMACLLPKYQMLTATAWGVAIGAWISGILFGAHVLVGTLIMQAAYSARIACYASIILLVCAGMLIASGILLAIPGSTRRSYKAMMLLATIAALVLISFYVHNSRQGADLYLAALRIRPDFNREYIHYTQDGGWTRTFESHSDAAQIFFCDRLIRDYPNCIYTPQSLYLKAKCQYASWEFGKATSTLRLLSDRYRDFRGSGSLLMAHADLCTGQYEDVTEADAWSDPILAQWLRGDGRLLLGHAYEVLGDSLAARSRYSAYINGLSSSSLGERNIWTAPAIKFAEFRFNRVLSPSSTRRSMVSGRVLCDNKSLAGVHIALVQPHIDASDPEDSRQFTGALTIPLWFGLAATTDSSGKFSINNVPYGKYDVVIGFETRSIPSDRVISNGIPPIEVDRTNVCMDDIHFVPSISLVSPIEQSSTDKLPTLAWKAYPGAAYYSVSIVSQVGNGPVERTDLPLDGYTCWTESHITTNQLKVTPDHFVVNQDPNDESMQHSLLRGRQYMWIVLAHDRNGKVISSSERYRHNIESTFIIAADVSKGG